MHRAYTVRQQKKAFYLHWAYATYSTMNEKKRRLYQNGYWKHRTTWNEGKTDKNSVLFYAHTYLTNNIKQKSIQSIQ